MPHLGHHIRLRLRDDRVIAPTAEQRRQVARVVLHHGLRYNLVAMALADSHLHIEALCGSVAAGRFAHGSVAVFQTVRWPRSSASGRELRWLRTRDADSDLVMAIRLQLGYRSSHLPPNAGTIHGAQPGDPD